MSEAVQPRRSLGRGLSALLGETSQEAAVDGTPSRGTVQMIPVASIEPHPTQPRRHFDEEALDELAQSIAERGVIQPIIVRPHGHRFQIVAGERRWRAAQRARLHELPAIVRAFSETETLEIALIENIQRQDLSAIEEAQGYRRLMGEYGHTQEALGRLVHKSRSHVANLLRLLDLPAKVQELLADGSLSMGHARALISSPDPAALAEEVVRRGLSVRDTERLARAARSPRKGKTISGGTDADIAALERQLGDLLGLKISIQHGPNGGAVTLRYTTLEQLDLICKHLTGGAI